MELKKVQKQGRDERTQEDYRTSAKIHTRCRVAFLRSFISALFLHFFQLHPYLKSSFTETFSLLSVLFSGVSKPSSNYTCRRRTWAGDEPVSSWRRTRWKRTFELKPHIHTHTQLATSDFQTDLRPRWLLLTSTHLWKRAESRSRTNLQVYATSTSYIYAIAFSARLNGLQVDQVDREDDTTNFYLHTVSS